MLLTTGENTPDSSDRSKGVAIVPVYWMFDQEHFIGAAQVTENGEVVIKIKQSEETKHFFDQITRGVLQSFSVGYTEYQRKNWVEKNDT
jgi:hypothetical protein